MTAIVVSLIILIFYIRILYTEINVEGVAQVINLMLIVSEEVAHTRRENCLSAMMHRCQSTK